MAERDYAVGRGRPPKHSRFRKGQSGNPAGRPRGSRDLRATLLDELSSQVRATENGRPVRVSKSQLVMKSLIAKVVGGDMRAAGLVLNLILSLERTSATAAAGDGPALDADDAAIVAAFARKVRQGGGHD
jgi:hypothetical protein